MQISLGENNQVIAIYLYVTHFSRLCQPTGTIGKYGYWLATCSSVSATVTHRLSLSESWACLTWAFRLSCAKDCIHSYCAVCDSPATTLMLSLQVTCCSCCDFTFTLPEMATLPSSFDHCVISMDLAVTLDSSNVIHKTDLCSWLPLRSLKIQSFFSFNSLPFLSIHNLPPQRLQPRASL